MARKTNKSPADPKSQSDQPAWKSMQTQDMIAQVTYNVQQELIVITYDKIELCLSKHMKFMEQRQAWLIPTGIFVSTFTALISSDFHDMLGVSNQVWRALFILAAIGSFVWAIVSFCRRGRAKTVEQIIDELKAKGTIQKESIALPQFTASASETPQSPKARS